MNLGSSSCLYNLKIVFALRLCIVVNAIVLLITSCRMLCRKYHTISVATSSDRSEKKSHTSSKKGKDVGKTTLLAHERDENSVSEKGVIPQARRSGDHIDVVHDTTTRLPATTRNNSNEIKVRVMSRSNETSSTVKVITGLSISKTRSLFKSGVSKLYAGSVLTSLLYIVVFSIQIAYYSREEEDEEWRRSVFIITNLFSAVVGFIFWLTACYVGFKFMKSVYLSKKKIVNASLMKEIPEELARVKYCYKWILLQGCMNSILFIAVTPFFDNVEMQILVRTE
jgi:hypothetical protein